MSENKKLGYYMQSRGYKTKGHKYKDRYVDDKICPECGGNSIYRDEWNTVISYKCIRRSCRYQWFESKNPEKRENIADGEISPYEKLQLDTKEREEQNKRDLINHYLMTVDMNRIDRKDDTQYSLVGYITTEETVVLGKHLKFNEIVLIIEELKDKYQSFNIIEEKMVVPMPTNLFIVANAECHLSETRELFFRPSHLKETYIMAGNFVGPHNFIKYMNFLLAFKQRKAFVFLRGKNEHNVLEYIHQTYCYIGDVSLAINLIQSIEDELGYSLKELPNKEPHIYDLIQSSTDYFENDTHIVVSGGVDLTIPFWKQSDKQHLYCTTNNFLDKSNYTGKIIVFGDATIDSLNNETNYGVWKNTKENKIGINGDVSGGNKLFALSILNGQTNYLTARNKRARFERLLNHYTFEEIEEIF